MLLPGHVIKITDPWTAPPKQIKRHVCVCPERRLFLRINSSPLWPPFHRLSAVRNPGLIDWDSFVELRQLFRFPFDEVRRAITRQENPLGRMSEEEANALAWAARQSPALSEDSQGVIWDNLANLKY